MRGEPGQLSVCPLGGHQPLERGAGWHRAVCRWGVLVVLAGEGAVLGRDCSDGTVEL